MSAVRGPHRLILLRSGVYGFADVEIDQPLHLVAANNVGKTTLIAALQFLYVDDARQMHFSHEWSATKKHYFPHTNSFVLFECMTELGWWVVGARGLGVTRAHDFERFVYQGRFEREDFFEGRRHRPWNEIRDRVVAKQYKKLEPKDLRHALTGTLEEAPLGLVPLRQSSNYKSFRVLFRNLLRLSHLPARELQELLIDIHRHLLDHPKIDLHDSHEQYQRAMRKADALRELQASERDIRKAIYVRQQRDDARGELVFLWRQLRDDYESETGELRRQAADLADELETTSAKLGGARGELEQTRRELNATERDYGAVHKELRDLDGLREAFADFDVEATDAQIEEVQEAIYELVGRLHGLSDADPDRVARRAAELRRQIDDDRRVLANLKDLVITRLRQDPRLSDEQIEDISRLLHPQLLRLSVDGRQERSLAIRDLDDAVSRLLAVAERFDESAYRDATVTIARDALVEQTDLGAEFEPTELEARIAERQDELDSLERLQRDLDQRAELERHKQAREDELEQLQRSRRDWHAWREREQKRPELEERRRQLDDQRRQYEDTIGELEQAVEELRGHEADQQRQRAQVEQRRAQLQQAFSQLTAPSFDAEPRAPSDEELFDRPLEALFDDYRTLAHDERSMSSRVGQLLDEIDRSTGSRFSGVSEEETVDNLEKALESLEEQEEALDQLWRSLIAGLRRQLKGLLDDLTEIKRQISRLNKTLAGRQISNLAKLELVVRPNDILVGRIEDILAHQEQPLFADARKAEKAGRELARLLEDHPKLELGQLFSLQFRIEDASGESKRFETLDQIESQGTTVTIKVLVHLELLHRMLREGEAHIPFFLDEVSVLDDQNLSAVVAHARAMNFVPVVASPDARDCVDTLYFLRSSDGEVILDPRTSRVRLKRASSPNGSGNEPGELVQQARQEALLDD